MHPCTVWEPHNNELTTQLEMVQRTAARFVTADYRRRHSITLILNQLQWQTLLERRTHSKVTMLYRIHHHLVSIPAGTHIISFTPTLHPVATFCSCSNTTAASTPTSTPSSLASSTCGNNCHQTQWGQHRSICSRTDSPSSHCIKTIYIGPCFISTSPCSCSQFLLMSYIFT